MIKTLKSLTEKTEQMAKALEKLDTPLPARKKAAARKGSKPSAAKGKKAVTRRPARKTAADTVLGIIKKNKEGINTAALEKKTDFNAVKVRNIISRLKKQGKIQTKSRGIYVAI
ncbi:MAG: hypothetical protein JRJ09_08120 [Deltaproteobacteria bacterium]|nr:hypothetical protein [Deltaproteobacteria bacterium]MBW2048479.1 hypothetical protein [Deltaproteobacteria bacterium]MBW2111065.1 hypothetical protein [Deltaproteobacteria bacterium]MBW2353027.1 hypothetical protein [Deltaproteobacteria bacterium]